MSSADVGGALAASFQMWKVFTQMNIGECTRLGCVLLVPLTVHLHLYIVYAHE